MLKLLQKCFIVVVTKLRFYAYPNFYLPYLVQSIVNVCKYVLALEGINKKKNQ